MTEQAAIMKLKQGDIQGLETLVYLYQLQAVRLAYLITHDQALAEDIVQAAFLRVYDRIDQFDACRPFGPWFLRSVVNDAIKASTRQQSHMSLERPVGETTVSLVEILANAELTPDAIVEQAEARQIIRSALERLTPIQRGVIVRRYFLEMSEAEMATDLACPPGTIKRRLHAARARLRQILRPFGLIEPRTSQTD